MTKYNNSNKQKKNDITAYIVKFGRTEGEDGYENYTSYSVQIDRLPGATSSLSNAIHSSTKFFGRIYTRFADGTVEEFYRDLKKV